MELIAKRRTKLAGLVLLMLFFVVGCSGTKTYPNSYKKNLFIQTAADSGSKLTSTKVTLDIYNIVDGCNTKYLGTIRLNKTTTEVGLPVNQSSYLIFNFYTSGFLSNNSSSISQQTVLMPKKGHRYRINATYSDDIYNVVIKEFRPGANKPRNITLSGLRSC